ncbi:Predicted protein [Paenibacillus sp. UNCCL117]|uniref:phosphodiester glycosidase family protein n=1 Tax=unclassified Paenibacillus TaxID=185978 RepID=UPI00087F089E|nr:MULTISPECIES: phosphodiester glycosidase family protein [unclassified Paenibacillus]SDC15292.1 Predicted protein [Paenibacillus sp. cl123]SFW17517.1 Predicted protein [Paenibacillus sp. UNCCL117]
MKLSKRLVHVSLSWMLVLAVMLGLWMPQAASATALTVTPIHTAADLELIRSNPSGNFKLMADITLTGSFTPISSLTGTLDGNGHIISGLTITASATQPKAAFIVENKGTIEKIGFTGVNITGLSTDSTYWAGGIVGWNRGTIQESFVTGSVKGGYRSAGIAVTNYSQIKNVYSVATVQAAYESAALVAVSETGSMLESSYAVPAVSSADKNTGGIAAYAYTNATIRNNALLAGTVANGSGLMIARITGRVNGTPVFQNNIASANALVQGAAVTGGTSADNQGLTVTDSALQLQTTYEDTLGWNFYSVWEMSAVLGHPILRNVQERKDTEIATAADLALIRSNPGGDFKLTADITLTGLFTPISSFTGTLDGNGHTISGLTITASASQPKAAFIVENKGIIEKIGFVDAAIVGSSADASHWAGGITAMNRGTIKESFVTGVVTGGARSAAIAVYNYNLIRNCYSDAIVKAKVESGGLVAVSEGGSVLEKSYAVPDVNSKENNTGGISAYAYTNATIRDNALLAGTITNAAGSNIGRITGRVNGTPVFQNNMASAGALVQGVAATGGTSSNKQGLTVTDNALQLQSTYQNTLGWDFTSVWKMSSSSSRPVLKAFAAEPSTQPYGIVFRAYRDNTDVLSSGVTHRQMDFIDGSGNIQKANIIDVDLSLPQNKIMVGVKNNVVPPTDANGNYIRTVDQDGHDVIKGNVAVQAATTVLPGKKVVAGVNGEFYTEQGPEGYMIKDGSSIINGVRVPGVDGKNYPFHGFLGIRNDGTAMIGNYGIDWQQHKTNLFQASGGQFWMVKNGTVQDFNGLVISDTNHPDYDNETYYRHKDRHPRTAAGIRSNGSVFFVVVDGRGANDSTGFYIEELGQYMKELGAYQALNMDGGGSSTAVTYNSSQNQYEIRNTPINKVNGVNTPGAPRDVFSSLLVVVDQP